MLPLDDTTDRRPCRHAVLNAPLLDVDNLRLALRLADHVSVPLDGDSQRRVEDVVKSLETDRVEIFSTSDHDLLDTRAADLVLTDQYNSEFLDEHDMNRQPNTRNEYNILILPPTQERISESRLPETRHPFRLASLGGTFNNFHFGHEIYFEFALTLAESIHIFIADDTYAAERSLYSRQD
jgi:hypothetical protein